MSDGSESVEFSRAVVPSQIASAGETFLLEATAGERAALAARFDLVSIGEFQAALRLAPTRVEGVLRLTGTISARVVQRCVVTLEPVPAEVEAPVDIVLMPAGPLTDEIDVEEDVEPYEDDRIDLGEIVAEELALGLDPYPRSPGAGPPGSFERKEKAPDDGPFAGLAALRGRK